MQDFNDSLKHLRGIHLVFVLASVAIMMALSGSDSVYETAAEQLHDVVRLGDALPSRRITASISETAEVSKVPNGLKTFVVESLAEYLQPMNIYWSSGDMRFFEVEVSEKEEYGHVHDMTYDWYDEGWWFGWQVCLLSDGTNMYTHPSDLDFPYVTERTTLGDYWSFLNQLVGADRLYVAPAFYSQYLWEGSVADRYKLPADIRKTLRGMEDVELGIKLTEVTFTDSESRKVFKTAQEHAVDSTAAYANYNFKFDTLTLDIDAISGTHSQYNRWSKPLSFSMELPVMFRSREPRFVADALQQSLLDDVYYARYLSGARSFERLFPELAEVATNLPSVTPADLERHLEEQSRSSGAPISLLGLQIGRNLIEGWGVFLMLCVQLYFCMHYRTLVHRIPRNGGILFPWIGLYRDRLSTTVFHISVALPFFVCFFVALRPDPQFRFRLLEIVWVVVALCLLGWTEVVYIRFRRMSAQGARHAPKSDPV